MQNNHTPHGPAAPPQPQGQPAGTPPPPQPGQQPVAYDNQGRPLYLHPSDQPQQPQMVYIARPRDPQDVPMSPEVLRRHEESRKKYPALNLSEGEYVISAVKRHPIGILKTWLLIALMMAAIAAVAFMFVRGSGDSVEGYSSLIAAGVAIVYFLLLLGGMAATYVYDNNRFYLTNESVIQEIQETLFSKHEQTVSLANIEDASYKQRHIIQTMFNYGTIRLSTEGDETTYIFDYVAGPKKHIAVLNNAVEAFKNGRPVDPEERH